VVVLPLYDEVRSHCAAIAADARWIRIDAAAADVREGVAGLDPELHFLEGSPDDVARYVLVLEAINFGSGWFAELGTGTAALTARLTEHARVRGGPWTAEELRTLDAAAVGEVLGHDPAHELMALYAEGLRQLGGWLGDRSALEAVGRAGGSADRLARDLAAGMPFFADHGFYKRAQIAAADLAHAGVATFDDLDRLTIFADDLVPHVLRTDGVLHYDAELAAVVDAGRPLEASGAMEQEIRACAVHACELIAERHGIAPRILDNWLWNRGQRAPYDAGRTHRTRTVFY
jgi:hypothetical protein